MSRWEAFLSTTNRGDTLLERKYQIRANPNELNCCTVSNYLRPDMVEMEYQSIPKLIPIKMSNMFPNISLGTKRKGCALRLLLPKPDNDSVHCPNQKMTVTTTPKDHLPPQNHTFETPLVSATKFQDPKERFKVENFRKRKQMNRSYISCNPTQSQISAIDVNMLDEEFENANLLPSKRDNKMSEITLIPIAAKVCGCPGPCEIITCEVIVQQYVDQNEVSLMLAMNIEEEEINAYVIKHCDNKYCDALNIDHNRCRRGLIELYRCDQSNVCDICQITMKGWKSRLYHNGCEKKNEYRHNNVSPERLLRDRFHLRELQIMEDSRIKKKNYLDPINGPALALETIRNNKELIITPKTKISSLKPAVTITAVSSTALTSVSQAVTVTSQASKPKNVVSNAIVTPLHSNVALSSNSASLHTKQSVAQQTGLVQFSNAKQNTCIMTSPSTTSIVTVPPSQSRYICLPYSSSITVQPKTVQSTAVQLATVQLATVQPATVQPATVQPAIVQPAIVQPATVQPVTVQSVTVQPTTVQPATVQSATVLANVQSATIRRATVQPTTMSNLTVSHPRVVTNTLDQPKPLLAPIRVMPITNLKTAPSLLHRQQGIPKFCVMAGNVITTLTVPNTQTLQSIIAAAQQEDTLKAPVNIKAKPVVPTLKRPILQHKRILSKKTCKQFFCVYCCKHFSTEWYFKKHVARHEKEKHTPRVSITSLCDKHGRKSRASEECDVLKEHDYDYACDSPYSSIRSPVDGTNGELEPHVQLEYDTEYYDGDFASEMNNCTMIGGASQVERKKIKYEETFDTWNGNVEIFRNGIKIEAQDDVYIEDISLEHHDIEESSFNENYNAEGNKFTIVSVVGNTNSENVEEEDVTALS